MRRPPRGLIDSFHSPETSECGKSAVFRSSNDVNVLKDVLVKEQISHVVINENWGYLENNVEFLLPLKDMIEGLSLIINSDIEISPIKELKNLKFLTLSFDRKQNIDFSNFTQLEFCRFLWIKGDESIFGCTNLQYLDIWKFPQPNLEAFAPLNQIKELLLVQGKMRTLTGIRHLKNLTSLELSYMRSLTSIEDMEYLTLLQKIHIENCPQISNIDNFDTLKELRELEINSRCKLETIKALKGLFKLKSARLIGVEILDGDTSPLIGKGEVIFGTFPHYNYTMKQIEEINKTTS